MESDLKTDPDRRPDGSPAEAPDARPDDEEPGESAAEAHGGDDGEAPSDNDTGDSDSDDDEYMKIADLKRAMKTKPESEVKEIFEKRFSAMQNIFQKFPQTPKRKENGFYTDEFKGQLEKISNAFDELEIYPVKMMRESQRKAGEILADSGSVEIICDMIVDELESKNYLSEDPDVQEVAGGLLRNAVAVIWNFSDHNHSVVVKVREHPRFLPKVMEKLKEWQKPHLEFTLEDNDFWVDPGSFLTIIHNVGLHDDSITRLRQLKTIEIIRPYLKSHDEDIRMTTAAILADIMTDDQAQFFSTESGVLETIISLLDNALDDPKHTSGGWRIAEIVRAIHHLARNDENKRTLVEEDVLPSLAKGLSSDLEGEKEVCLEAILVLSFREDNAKDMARDEELIDRVVKLYQDKSDTNKQCRRTAESLLWQLRHELEKTERYRTIAQEFLDSAHRDTGSPEEGDQTTKDESAGHVMLSYNWAHQEDVKKIYSCLRKHGLKVWMDIHEMGGSTRQSMADAVEKADVVLCCFSRKYKDSSNCRQELEYACDCEKPIIPLKMQQDYKPDGWLGFTITGKLFYDFSGKYDFDQKFKELLKAVQRYVNLPKKEGSAGRATRQKQPQKEVYAQGKDDVDGPIVVTSSAIMVTAPLPSEKDLPRTSANRITPREVERVRSWSQAEVRAWLSTYGVEGKPLELMSGEEVAVFYSLRAEAPEFYQQTLEQKFQVHAFREINNFGRALDDLAGYTLTSGRKQRGQTQSKTCTVL